MLSQIARRRILSRSVQIPSPGNERAFGRILAQEAQHQYLSTSAAAEYNRPRRRTRSINPITVTDAAAARIQELLQGENARGAVGIRLGTKRRGCNGLSYTLNYAFPADTNEETSEAAKREEKFVTPQGITVWIEPMALMNIVGTTMDWEETELTSEFTFINPNSKGQCGCGESFNV